MSYKSLIIGILFVFPAMSLPAQTVQSTAVCQTEDVPAREVNFDELEDLAKETNAFEKAEFAKPSRLMIFVQMIGTPLFSAYLTLTNAIARVTFWINSVLIGMK